MEGNDCYKFATIRNYVDSVGNPIRVALDIGANIGNVSHMIRGYFPTAIVYAFEGVPEYAAIAHKRTMFDPRIKLFAKAVTNLCGRLSILKGISGLGHEGGSIITDEAGNFDPGKYELLNTPVDSIRFDDLVAAVCLLEGVTQIDYIKMDCEGCEHSCLGSASIETLKKIRFISGEYHGIEKFYGVMRTRLYLTHRVNLIGDKDFGAFFCEPIGNAPAILASREGMLFKRPWLSSEAIDWHPFKLDFVPVNEMHTHDLGVLKQN